MKLDRREDQNLELEALWSPFARDGAMGTATTKRTSQRLFREHPRVRFLVSTEAGGEGINLQFCHICVNYDLPWNPMRVEQRVGRVYRYGQDKVVQVYHLLNKATIEETVQSYFEDRLDRAAEAIAKVTGEDAQEIMATLNGQLESEIDPATIYQRALVEGDLNKQTKEEIAEAVARAKRAYEIATKSLFRDCSSYSFDKYQRELATDLTLDDVRHYAERFLSLNRRQLQKKGEFLEFIVPEALKAWELKIDCVQLATFDREQAIHRSDAEFLALGHPVVDAMLQCAGTYDFGGLAAVRRIVHSELAGRAGYLFLFVVRQRIAHEAVNECLFQFQPIFVTDDQQVDEKAAAASVLLEARDDRPSKPAPPPEPFFQIARTALETATGLWTWEDDVEFLGLSWVEFCEA